MARTISPGTQCGSRSWAEIIRFECTLAAAVGNSVISGHPAYNGYHNGIKHNASINVNNNRAPAGATRRVDGASERASDRQTFGGQLLLPPTILEKSKEFCLGSTPPLSSFPPPFRVTDNRGTVTGIGRKSNIRKTPAGLECAREPDGVCVAMRLHPYVHAYP